MENLRIHFKQGRPADRLLAPGVHRLLRGSGGTLDFDGGAPGVLLAQFCVDRRGLWLQVAAGVHGGIHVNGRPVRRMALLRAGDVVHADGVEMQVQGRAAPAGVAGVVQDDESDQCVVLRGIGGVHHGRCFPLSRKYEVGNAEDADIRVDIPGATLWRARLERVGSQVRLTGLDAGQEASVNGVLVRDALLSAGDQVVFGPQSRFAVEVPWPAGDPLPGDGEAGDTAETEVARSPPPSLLQSAKRWPWLLLAALLLGAALSALLLFGPH
ncbi:MAG: FHA domain-containing protein [Pseudoxanthomonas sp.]